MKTLFSIIICLVTVWSLLAQPKVTISDFENLDKSNWSGNLMYINYSDGSKFTIRTTMQITLKGDKILLDVRYPDEPKANSKESIRITKTGSYLGNEELIKKNYDNGILTLVTKFKGKDNNKKAMMYKTYTISETAYIVEKEVRYMDTEERIVRNRYNYKRSE